MSNHHEIKNENYDTNTFMTNHHEIEKEFLIVENLSKNEKISLEDMENSNSIRTSKKHIHTIHEGHKDF